MLLTNEAVDQDASPIRVLPLAGKQLLIPRYLSTYHGQLHLLLPDCKLYRLPS